MTPLARFVHRWRAWRRALQFIATYASSMAVRHEIVVVLRIEDADRFELDEIRTALPGWHVAWSGDDELRCVPPAITPQRRPA
jgi:hypothetical protein